MNDPFQKPPYINQDATQQTSAQSAPSGASEAAPFAQPQAAPLYQAAPEITPLTQTAPGPAAPQFSQPQGQPQAAPAPQSSQPQRQPQAAPAPLYQAAPGITPVAQPGNGTPLPEAGPAAGNGKKDKKKKKKQDQKTIYIREKVKDTSGAFALTFGILAFLSLGVNVFASITAIILAGVSKKHHGYKTVFARMGKALGIISLILFIIIAIACIAGYVWLFMYHGHML